MRVGSIGSGNMASALARGWGDPVLVTDGAARIRHGLKPAIAGTLVTETMAGAAALNALERGGVRPAPAAAMDDVLGET